MIAGGLLFLFGFTSIFTAKKFSIDMIVVAIIGVLLFIRPLIKKRNQEIDPVTPNTQNYSKPVNYVRLGILFCLSAVSIIMSFITFKNLWAFSFIPLIYGIYTITAVIYELFFTLVIKNEFNKFRNALTWIWVAIGIFINGLFFYLGIILPALK